MLTENHLEVGTVKAKSYPHMKSSSLWILKWEVRAECLLWLHTAILVSGCSEETGNSRVKAMGLLEMQVRTTGILSFSPGLRLLYIMLQCVISNWENNPWNNESIFYPLNLQLPKNTAKAQWIPETFSTDLRKCGIRLLCSQKFFVITIFWPRE